jgi:hypothetical protein
VFSKDFDPVANVRARLTERPYSHGAKVFAVAIAGHLRPVGNGLQTRGVRMRDLAAEAGIALTSAQRSANELCDGSDPIFEKALTMERNIAAASAYISAGAFPRVAVRSFVLIPPRS